MPNPFIGEIRIFAGNFAIRDFAFCDGQLLPIAQNTALFSILGTTYGGDGQTTFGLPNLQQRLAIHAGHGPGLTSRVLGQTGGSDTASLSEAQLASHTHALMAKQVPMVVFTSPQGNTLSRAASLQYQTAAADVDMNAQSTTITGGTAVHNNRQPTQNVSYLICLVGVYPSRP